MVIKIR